MAFYKALGENIIARATNYEEQVVALRSSTCGHCKTSTSWDVASEDCDTCFSLICGYCYSKQTCPSNARSPLFMSALGENVVARFSRLEQENAALKKINTQFDEQFTSFEDKRIGFVMYCGSSDGCENWTTSGWGGDKDNFLECENCGCTLCKDHMGPGDQCLECSML